jgi:hypothetical protein
MSENPTIVPFLLSSCEYTKLWLKLKNREADEELINLVNILIQDHSNLLKVIIDDPKIKIVWTDTLKQDGGHGKEKQKK